MSDSRRFETELHEGDLVFTVRRRSDLLFSKRAVRALQEEVETVVECAVSRSEAVAISGDSSVVNSRHVERNVQFQGDSPTDRLRVLITAVGGKWFFDLIEAIREIRTLSAESLQFAIVCGLIGLAMLMLSVFNWYSIVRGWEAWRRRRRLVGVAKAARPIHRRWWSRDG